MSRVTKVQRRMLTLMRDHPRFSRSRLCVQLAVEGVSLSTYGPERTFASLYRRGFIEWDDKLTEKGLQVVSESPR